MARHIATASTSNYLQAANGIYSPVPGTNGVTIACWFRTSTAGAASVFPMLFGRYNDNLAGPSGLYLSINASNATPANALIFQYAISGSLSLNLHSSGAVNDGNWHHACGVIDLTPGTSTLYLDGASVASATPSTGGTTGLVSNTLNVAWAPNGAVGNPYAGDIADCAFWGAALTTIEILALFQGIRPNHLRKTPLLGWWPLDGLASPEPDATSGNYSRISGLAVPIPNNMTVNGTVTQIVGPPISLFTLQMPTAVLPFSVPPTVPPVLSYCVM
jgi:hypothetical protein